MQRREFIQKGLGAAALLASGVCLDAQTPHRIKVGFLGIAYSHAVGKLKVLLASPDYEVLGYSEDDRKFHQSFEQLGARHLSKEDLFQGSELIVVESEIRSHARHGLEVLEHGKHLHLEKTPATTLHEFKSIVALAKAKNLQLQGGYMWRYHPGFEWIREGVAKGWLGEIYQVRGSMHTQLGAEARKAWAEFPGGAMFEQGSHLIDQMVRMMGAPKKVTPFLRQSSSGDSLKDNNLAILEFDRATGIISNSTLQPNASMHRSFEVLGTNGTATMKPIEPPRLEINLAKPAGPYKAGTQIVELPAYERYVDDFVELAGAIRGKGKLRITLDQELEVHSAVLKASDML